MTAIEDTPQLRAARELFDGYRRPFWVAGGWAADLHVGSVQRDHGDVDVMILDRDVDAFADRFGGHQILRKDHSTDLEHAWKYPEHVEPGRDTLRVADLPAADGIEVMVAKTDGEDWVFHRGGRIRRPLAEIGLPGPAGLPYLQPDLLLLFKARDGRPKDDDDFRALLPLLSAEQKAWLLPRLTPPGRPEHPWAAALAGRD